MEQTESAVVQVAPDYENDKIKEMESFGWNLQGRQEIHEKGEAFGRPSYIDSSTYVVKTTVYKYVKLHFARPKSLPGISKIRPLESEYQALPFPPSPGGLVWPVLFTLVPIPASIAMLADPMGKHGSPGLGGLIIVAGWIALGIYWIKNRIRKRDAASSTRAASNKRAGEILNEVRGMTSG